MWRRSIAVIERLFSSRTLFMTLALFFRYPEEPLNPRLISRHTGTDVKCVHRELKKLEDIGIVRRWSAGKYRYYFLDSGHPVHEELRSIFAKTKQEWELVTQSPSVRMWEKYRMWKK
ncbi:MAG: winged helix-turn-helix transcriptional regulator [Deltaproteobacteria bacterium]|nr:winged helix-turn-helix transcriptional regulator [Deltaproteobacteria bacterium]